MQIKFNIAEIKLCTKTEGPFLRCCIWFQGCTLHCEGCCNYDLQPLTPNHIMDIDQLTNVVILAKEKYDIEGVTLSGGEPSLQKGLDKFISNVKALDLGIILFSGYNKKDLDSNLLKDVDLLIDGPFDAQNVDNDRVLLGSKNKRLNFLTDRYINQKSYFINPISIEEVCIDEYIFINGD